MDFRGRPSQATSTPVASSASQPSSNNTPNANRFNGVKNQKVGKLIKIGSVLLLFSVTALVLSLTFLVTFNHNKERQAVDKAHFQAVFLNNGQVYFGNIRALDDKVVDLRNIYYLQTNNTSGTTTTTTPANVSLAKLGCELHAPYDQMLINKDQVIFWENIQDSSQVVKAIKDYVAKKIDCSTQSQNSTEQAPSSSTTTTTPATTTKKP